jgi:hypothetical protein
MVLMLVNTLVFELAKVLMMALVLVSENAMALILTGQY